MSWFGKMPQVFIVIGVAIYTPSTLWWIFVTRPRERALKRQCEQNGLYWRIRKLEEDVFGEWRS